MSAIGSVSGSTSNLSQVGQSLLTTGQAPNPAPPTAPASSKTQPVSQYQAEYVRLQKYDNAELLYASFLDPAAALANFDAVMAQAGPLLAAPNATASSQASTPPPASTSTPTTVPSTASILAASDAAAQQTLAAYASAPAGASILDYQA